MRVLSGALSRGHSTRRASSSPGSPPNCTPWPSDHRCRPPLPEEPEVFVKSSPGGLAYSGSSAGAVGLHAGVGFGLTSLLRRRWLPPTESK
jgi:hypothetical protein